MATIPNGKDFGDWLIANKANPSLMAASPRAGLMRDFMNGTRSNFIRDEFAGDVLNGFWTTAQGAGGTAFAVPAAASAIAGGGITGTTGASANDTVCLYTHPTYSGDLNAGCMFTASLDVVTSMILEIGFTDPLTGYTTAGALNDIDTPSITNGAVTVAILGLDTSQTLTTAALVMDGDATYATSSVTPASAGYSAWSPTAGARFTAIVQLQGQNMYGTTVDTARLAVFNANNQLMFDISKPLAVEGGTAIHPYFLVKTLNTTPKVVTMHRAWVWGDKA